MQVKADLFLTEYLKSIDGKLKQCSETVVSALKKELKGTESVQDLIKIVSKKNTGSMTTDEKKGIACLLPKLYKVAWSEQAVE